MQRGKKKRCAKREDNMINKQKNKQIVDVSHDLGI